MWCNFETHRRSRCRCTAINQLSHERVHDDGHDFVPFQRWALWMMQRVVAGTEQCQPTTASNFCYFSTPNFSIRRITIFFAHVLVVASSPCEAVLHSRPLQLDFITITFYAHSHTHTATKNASNQSQNDTNKTHLS